MSGIAEDLSKLKGLFDQGAINEAEYTAAKAKLLTGSTADPAPVVVNTPRATSAPRTESVAPWLEITAGLAALIGVMLPWGSVSGHVGDQSMSHDIGMGTLASGLMLRMIFIGVICGVVFRFFTATARWRGISYFSTLVIGGYCAYIVLTGVERVGQLGANFSFTPGIGLILSMVGMIGLAVLVAVALARPTKVPQWTTAMAISLSAFIAFGSIYGVVEQVMDRRAAQAELARMARDTEHRAEQGW